MKDVSIIFTNGVCEIFIFPRLVNNETVPGIFMGNYAEQLWWGRCYIYDKKTDKLVRDIIFSSIIDPILLGNITKHYILTSNDSTIISSSTLVDYLINLNFHFELIYNTIWLQNILKYFDNRNISLNTKTIFCEFEEFKRLLSEDFEIKVSPDYTIKKVKIVFVKIFQTIFMRITGKVEFSDGHVELIYSGAFSYLKPKVQEIFYNILSSLTISNS